MKKTKILFSLILLTLYAFGQQEIKCRISGRTIDRPQNETLLLTPYGSDFRVVDAIKIPIIDNHFEYELVCQTEEFYELTFESDWKNGQWSSIPFISENSSVKFELHPLDSAFFKDIVLGTGKLNKEYDTYRKSAEKLFRLKALRKEKNALPYNGLYPKAYDINKKKIALDEQYKRNGDDKNYKDQMELLRKDMSLLKDSIYTNEWKDIQKQLEKNSKEQTTWAVEYLTKSNSIFSLCESYRLLFEFKSAKRSGYLSILKDDENLTKAFQTVYRKKYPNHPITKKIEILMESDKIKEGGKYIDFSSPDYKGNNHTLSKEINGKIALLDLWASWCGPCRRNSKEMIPIYNEFKEKGFTIVGVSREYEKENGERAIEKDGYSWLNLLELKDANMIWYRYGVGNGGGATFLIDKDGKILKMNPSAEEVRKILSEKLIENPNR